MRMRPHIASALELHCTALSFRIYFMTLLNFFLFVYKSLNGLALGCLSDMVLIYVPSKSLTSSCSYVFVVLMVWSNTNGKACFCHYGPSLLNGLPEDLKGVGSVSIFQALV